MPLAGRVLILAALIGWPAFFGWLSRFADGPGLIWFMLHQIYYLPLSWLGSPLFEPDSEVGFSVQPTGRALTLFVYVLVFYIVVRILDRRRATHVN